ncbi:MAG: acetate--CoA ligase family protein [Bacteroidales bacterium]|nr:acetate--CoA ligase family protein [Bacteroidales bacterium]
MINEKLLNPGSIVVIGGSDDTRKPGGKVLENLIKGNYAGRLYVVNPKADWVQGIRSFYDVKDLPRVDLAILAIAARFTLPAVEVLARQKETKAFIILSAGFGEESPEGAELEKQIVRVIEENGGALIGPNCIGVITPMYSGVFTTPVPKLDPKGVTLISGSGATAVFIMEAGIPNGLAFSSVYSVGNSAQNGVEDVLAYLDEHFDPENSPKVILLYLEAIHDPLSLWRHASSLVRKGCRIAAVKAGTSAAGRRAASSHTGSMAGSDEAAAALFRKAGIVRCYSREELVTVAGVMSHPLPKGKNFAVITHAGGPAVMLTDTLSKEGLHVPPLTGPAAEALKDKLFPGSSVKNPVDFLATGTAEQLGYILDACEKDFENIDAMVVIFGSPGLFPVDDVYDLLDQKMKSSRKPVFPVLPSVINVEREIENFIARGRINFPDEVVLGRALGKVLNRPGPFFEEKTVEKKEQAEEEYFPEGYLSPVTVHRLLTEAGIPVVKEKVCSSLPDALAFAREMGFPVVMKAVGLIHKSDAGGVIAGIASEKEVEKSFGKIMQIEGVNSILLQPMLQGTELFAGVKRESGFGHVVLCGLGGIFIEVLRDYMAALAPLEEEEALYMIRHLKGYKLFRGTRGKPGIDERTFARILMALARMTEKYPAIAEMDLNPLLAEENRITVVDARIRIGKIQSA